MVSPLLHPGDVLFFSGKGFVSRGIKYFTNSKWSHVALYVGGGEGYVIEATGAGVEKNKLEDLLKHTTAFAARRIPNLTVEQVELMKDKAYGLVYDDYDYVQLFSLGIYYLLRRLGITWSFLVRSSKNKMICSELIAVCALCIPLKFKNKVKLVTPENLYTSSNMVTIYESETKC